MLRLLELSAADTLGDSLPNRVPLTRPRPRSVRTQIVRTTLGESAAKSLPSLLHAVRPRGEDRIERMLDDARVRAGRGRGQTFALDKDHARAGIGQESGGRRTDYPAPDDDDVGAVH